MLLLASLAILQSAIANFSVGPVTFQLDTGVAWNLSVMDREVIIDLNSLKIRAVKPDGSLGPALLPLKGEGVLHVNTISKSIKIDWWPPEWLHTTALRVDYLCRRTDNLWHERSAVQRVQTYHSQAIFEPGVGQRYVVCRSSGLAPALETVDGKPKNVLDIVDRPLVLVKHENGYYEFSPEGLMERFRFRSSEPLLAHPWFDAIMNRWTQWDGKEVYVRGRSFSATSRDGSILADFNPDFTPVKIESIYMTAKPRTLLTSRMGALSDAQINSLQPVVVIAKPLRGTFAKEYSYYFGKGAAPDRDTVTKRAKDPREFDHVVLALPAFPYLSTTFSLTPPEVDFAGRDRNLLPMAKAGEVVKGMTPNQVLWTLGPPISITGDMETGQVWTYMSLAPGWTVTFTKGRVSSIFKGRLP